MSMQQPVSVKQVIVIRKDLRMRRGKEIAQGAHASMAWLAHRLSEDSYPAGRTVLKGDFSDAEMQWLSKLFTKITCQVNSEEELNVVYLQARAAGLEAHRIVDAGMTEFGGVPTATAVAVGPDWVPLVDAVCGKLALY